MRPPQTILITGASSGIGAALALHYAAPGILLALTGRNAGRLENVATTAQTRGAQVIPHILNVTDRAAMTTALEALDDTHPLDLVIANAGISGGTAGGAHTEPEGQARHIFDVNLTGVLNTIEPLVPRMAARGTGQIALMSSLASFSGWPGAPAYSASKGAVRLYGEALRGNLARRGVNVSVICPGFIRTPMTTVNGFPMPFMMTAERGAAIIAAGLAKNRPRIAFPWQTYALAGTCGLLPAALSTWILAGLPAKPPADKETSQSVNSH